MPGGRTSLQTRALVLQRVPLGEADLLIALYTEARGRLSAVARSARRSRRRFGGTLEPFHELSVRLTERPGQELWLLDESSLGVVRGRLVQRLDAMEAAGSALGWVRSTVAPATPEPALWALLTRTLDALDRPEPSPAPPRLAECGLALLTIQGWGLELERCVRCGKPCEPGRSAMLDGARGGLVCTACGGAPWQVSAPQRQRLRRAALGEVGSLTAEDAELALRLVAGALATATR